MMILFCNQEREPAPGCYEFAVLIQYHVDLLDSHKNKKRTTSLERTCRINSSYLDMFSNY